MNAQMVLSQSHCLLHLHFLQTSFLVGLVGLGEPEQLVLPIMCLETTDQAMNPHLNHKFNIFSQLINNILE